MPQISSLSREQMIELARSLSFAAQFDATDGNEREINEREKGYLLRRYEPPGGCACATENESRFMKRMRGFIEETAAGQLSYILAIFRDTPSLSDAIAGRKIKKCNGETFCLREASTYDIATDIRTTPGGKKIFAVRIVENMRRTQGPTMQAEMFMPSVRYMCGPALTSGSVDRCIQENDSNQ